MSLAPAFETQDSLEMAAAEWAVTLAFAIPAVVALQFAIKAKTKSQRYNWLSYFFALLFLVTIVSKRSPSLSLVMSIVRMILGVLGALCALQALRLRKQDKGVGWVGPGIGGLLSAYLVFIGLSFFLVSHAAPSAAAEEPWTYRNEPHQYSITLPSKEWTEIRMEGASSAFKCRPLSAKFAVLPREQARDEYDKIVKDHGESKKVVSLREFRSESGKTASGYDYFMTSGFEKKADQEILARMCFIYRPERNQSLTVIGEWIPQGGSETGKASEQASVEAALRSILMTIK